MAAPSQVWSSPWMRLKQMPVNAVCLRHRGLSRPTRGCSGFAALNTRLYMVKNGEIHEKGAVCLDIFNALWRREGLSSASSMAKSLNLCDLEVQVHKFDAWRVGWCAQPILAMIVNKVDFMSQPRPDMVRRSFFRLQ